jgi:hypothetical protein
MDSYQHKPMRKRFAFATAIVFAGLIILLNVFPPTAVALQRQIIPNTSPPGDLPTTTGHMYTVTLNNFFVNHTRSQSVDTDYVSMGAQSCGRVNCVVGTTPIRTTTIFYRDVGCCGQHDIGLSLEPFFVTDGLRLDYSVLNYGHGGGSPYMTGNLNAVLSDVIHNGSAFNTKLLTIYLQKKGVGFGGCDGGLAADIIFYTADRLNALTSATGQFTITRQYLGYGSPFGCSGGVSDYFVTYTITRIS